MATLKQYVCDTYGKENIAEVNKMSGDNGAWISIKLKNGEAQALPVSKKEASQNADINDYNIFIEKLRLRNEIMYIWRSVLPFVEVFGIELCFLLFPAYN